MVQDIKGLPRLDRCRCDLVTFATKVKNSVTALESTKNIGYLHSAELVAEIMNKLPEVMVHNYNHHLHRSTGDQEPRLVSLANFLIKVAEIVCSAGTSDVLSSCRRRETRDKDESQAARQRVRPRRAFVLSENERAPRTSAESNNQRRRVSQQSECLFCNRRKHAGEQCDRFQALTRAQRWQWAREVRVCYQCLKNGHRQNQCREPRCQHPGCGRPHHALLHTEGGPYVSAGTSDRSGDASTSISIAATTA